MKPYLLHQLLAEAATRTADAPALIEPKRTVSYGALAAESARLSSALAEAGVEPGARVGLWSEKTGHAVAAVYGILRRGAAYVPIDPAVPPARAAWILRRVEARVVVTTADRVGVLAELKGAGELPQLERVVLCAPPTASLAGDARGFEVLVPSEERAPAPDARVSDGALAYILHTSGSTGQPKGVAISHRNALAFVEPAAEFFSITAADRLACQAPLHFDLSVFDLYCAALVGAPVVLLPEYFSAFPKKMAQAVVEHRVTIWNSVVSALGLLVDKGVGPTGQLESLRAVIFSGERMPIPLLARVRARTPNAALFNVYGQTEANSSMVYRVDVIPEDDAAALPLGEALPNFEVFLVDADGRPLGEGEQVGELCVRAATVASGGYFRAPELNEGKFVLDPERPDTGARVYRTGDLVKRSASGELSFVGRRDNMIKSRGYRIELSEIEVALEGVAGVAEVAVVALPSPDIGHSLHAFVQPEAGASIVAARLEAHLRARLPAYMVPETIDVRAELPRTATGKIDRKALAAERA